MTGVDGGPGGESAAGRVGNSADRQRRPHHGGNDERIGCNSPLASLTISEAVPWLLTATEII